MKFEDFVNEAKDTKVSKQFIKDVADDAGVDAKIAAIWINVMGIDDPDDMETEQDAFTDQLSDLDEATEAFLTNLIKKYGRARVSDLMKAS